MNIVHMDQKKLFKVLKHADKQKYTTPESRIDLIQLSDKH